jgi:hypothetical protein
VGGKITRLTGKLEKFLFRQFELGHELKGDICPGEEECAESGRIFERREEEGRYLPVLRICKGGKGRPACDALETKPSECPPDLKEAIVIAYGLCGSKRTVYNWPDALAPMQWACIRAYERAEGKLNRLIQEEREREREEQKKQRELEALQRR